MDAETMEAIARACCIACEENPYDNGDARGNAHRWQDYLPVAEAAVAALRAQAKAEPVYQLCVDEDAGGIGGVSWIDVEKSAYDLACDLGNCLPPRILYTAPPPDHAEALAEACELALEYFSAWPGMSRNNAEAIADEYAESIRAAITRYKETRNG